VKVVVSGTQDVTTPSLVSGGYTVAMEVMRVLCLVASGKGMMWNVRHDAREAEESTMGSSRVIVLLRRGACCATGARTGAAVVGCPSDPRSPFDTPGKTEAVRSLHCRACSCNQIRPEGLISYKQSRPTEASVGANHPRGLHQVSGIDQQSENHELQHRATFPIDVQRCVPRNRSYRHGSEEN
jgi:hypothetical protein